MKAHVEITIGTSGDDDYQHFSAEGSVAAVVSFMRSTADGLDPKKPVMRSGIVRPGGSMMRDDDELLG